MEIYTHEENLIILFFNLMSIMKCNASAYILNFSQPNFREKALRAGQIMRHRPMNARQTASFWIEHVLQFGGEHLKPSSVHLTWWQFYCLDTLGFIVSVTVLCLALIYRLVKFLLRTLSKLFRLANHAKRD